MADIQDLTRMLEETLGPDRVCSAPEETANYTVDDLQPKWVVFPQDAQEVARILRLAGEARLAVAPRGNGTKMGMGGILRAVDLMVSLNRLNRVVDCDIPNLTVTVEAGATLSEVQRLLADRGSFLPLDPPFAQATIGGILATNQSGPKRLLYGSARDLVLGVRAVLPQGDGVRFGGKVMKNVAGYDMSKLFLGSWGTLGIITEATFRILPLPEEERTLLATFPSLAQAATAIARVLDSYLLPSALELANPAAWQLIGQTAGISDNKNGYMLVASLEGFREATERQIKDMTLLCLEAGAKDVTVVAIDEQARLWQAIRDFSLPALAAQPLVVGLKAGLPISQVKVTMEATEELGNAYGLACLLLAHAGSGIIYSFFGTEKAQVENIIQAIHKLRQRVRQAGGSLVVEWAPKVVKEQIPVWGEPRPDWAIMRRIKEEFDPAGIMNPGKFLTDSL